MHLRLRGLSWREVARQAGVSPQSIQQTASGRPSLPIEKILATAIGVSPRALFPEHWAATGARIPNERPSAGRAQDSSTRAPVHVENRESA
ncbi:helix-turn-helix domain-containing protein [Castellaniella sp.]|uniref:helix-turn-helix domain-containing protein n=1 Tax=Castellaniella sp. TaxID=1955812 RepID=UPI003A599408